MFRGHRSQLGRSPASQGPSGEQSGGDDHTGGVSDTQQNQVYSHDLSDVDNLIRQSTSSGTSTHADQQTSTGYDVSASQHVFHPDADFDPGHYLDDVPFIQTNEDLSANHMPNFAEATSFSQRSLLDTGHDSSGNPVESCMYGNGVQVQGHSAISSCGFQGLSSEAELESIISSTRTRDAELAKIHCSSSSSVIPSSASQSFPISYENSGQMRRGNGGDIEGYYGNAITSFDPNLFQHQYLSGVATNDQRGNYQGTPTAASGSRVHSTCDHHILAHTTEASINSHSNSPQGYYENISPRIPFNQNLLRHKDLPGFSVSGQLGNYQGLPSSSTRGHFSPGSQDVSPGIQTPIRGQHQNDFSNATPRYLLDRATQHVHPLKRGRGAESSQWTVDGGYYHTATNTESSANREFAIISCDRGSELHSSSTRGQTITQDQLHDHFRNVLPSTRNTELAANQNMRVTVAESPATSVRVFPGAESRKTPLRLLESLFSNTGKCRNVDFDHDIYTVCLTDGWIRIDLRIQKLNVIEELSCEFAELIPRRTFYSTVLFKFPCGGSGSNISVKMSRLNAHLISVNSKDTELRGEMGTESHGWFPTERPPPISNIGERNAFCGAIPSFNGSIGFVALKCSSTVVVAADTFILALLSKLEGGMQTPVNQFDVLITNGTEYEVFTRVHENNSPMYPIRGYSVRIHERNNTLIITSPNGIEKVITLFRCGPLGSKYFTGSFTDAIKIVRASIIRSVMMNHMVIHH